MTETKKVEFGTISGIEVLVEIGNCASKLRFGRTPAGQYYVNYEDENIDENITRNDLLSMKKGIEEILKISK